MYGDDGWILDSKFWVLIEASRHFGLAFGPILPSPSPYQGVFPLLSEYRAMMDDSSSVTAAGQGSLLQKNLDRGISRKDVWVEIEPTFGNEAFSQRENPVKLRRNYFVTEHC
ncbi:hypothetical protein Zmor_024002 [Zophobas morio]|uniref:Uncharacterized protein n=1 Tax=Zophobas morio TaxID=2755281 RepID=A0AA38HZG2_9CUCU|nr:hypothetical protein Zmor_024002 [Zophobas morio]